MLNLSSNDYLGLASRQDLQEEFQASTQDRFYPYSSSSSRLLTGNFSVYTKLEKQIARSFDREAALIFNSGYHANTGILPALTDKQTLLLADKLVHASIIDGILLSGSPFLRYRHNDYDQLERLVQKNACQYETIIILTESIFSMDGDVADLNRLIAIKRQYPNILLYVDEAHAIGARGKTGLGIAEEQGCIQEIDLLVGTFGKALASMGAYLVCSRTIREYLVNTMRPLIFSTALPPFQIAWTSFIWEQLPSFTKERENLLAYSRLLAEALTGKGGEISQSLHRGRERGLRTESGRATTKRLLLSPGSPADSAQRYLPYPLLPYGKPHDKKYASTDCRDGACPVSHRLIENWIDSMYIN